MANDTLNDSDWEKRVFVRLPDITAGGPLDKPSRAPVGEAKVTKRPSSSSTTSSKTSSSIWMQAAFYGLIGLALAEVAYIGQTFLVPHTSQSNTANQSDLADTNKKNTLVQTTAAAENQSTAVEHQGPIVAPTLPGSISQQPVFQDPAIGNKFRDALLTNQQNKTQQNQFSESRESKNVASQPNRVIR